eukprot:1158707-Pelagomonas_calceolata.AAC.4
MFLYSTVSTLKPVRQGVQGRKLLSARQHAWGERQSAQSPPKLDAALLADAGYIHFQPPLHMGNPVQGGALTNGGDGGHNLAQLELVQDGGLTGSVQPDLQRRTADMLPIRLVLPDGGTQAARGARSSPFRTQNEGSTRFA